MFSVNLSSVQEQQLSNIVPEDSAFSTDEGTDNTSSDIQSDLLTGDSGIPVSPADSVPFPVSPEMVPPLVLDETADEASLPPWLEAELQDEVIPVPADFVIRSPEPVAQGFQWQPPPVDDLHLNLSTYQLASGGSSAFTPKEDEYSSIVVALQARIEVLEVENRQLKETVESQRQKIEECEHCRETSITHETA